MCIQCGKRAWERHAIIGANAIEYVGQTCTTHITTPLSLCGSLSDSRNVP